MSGHDKGAPKRTYREYAESLARERLGPSTRPKREDFPSDDAWLEAQRQWAHEIAEKHGWLDADPEPGF